MELINFVQNLTSRFQDAADIRDRLEYAKQIANLYRFNHPEIVLYYTHPEMSKLSMSERCKKLGLTEEHFILLSTQKGLQRFLEDYQRMSLISLRTQSFDKIGIAISEDRIKYDKYGNSMKDYDIEQDLVKQAGAAPQNSQVNVQVNLFDKARQRAEELK